MSAFVVFIRETMSSQLELEKYAELALPTLDGRPVIPRAFYGELDILEGSTFEGGVILEFQSMDDARAWYHSAEYQAAAKHRKAGSDYRVFIIDGVKQGLSAQNQ